MNDDAPARVDDTTLVALLQEEERLAATFRDTTLASEQEVAIDYYEAKPFGDEEEGRSQVVSPDVAEVVDYMTISVLRTCVSGDRVVEFEAQEAQQEESASEATEAVSYMFMRQQDGYKVLTDWLQSGLVEKIGIIKTGCLEEKKSSKVTLTHPTMDHLAMAMEEAPAEAVTENEDGSFTAQHRITRSTCKYIDMPVPSEEFLFSARCRDIDDVGYKAHRSRKTISELVDMGFDRNKVEALPNEDRSAYLDTRSASRWEDEGVIPETAIPGMRRVWLLEEYVNIDLNDDGIAELVQVFRVGNTILGIDEVEENPFVVFTPFPRAHRMVGNSLADKVMDIQRVRSVVLRQTLDGIYLTNNPRTWLPNECVDENTIDDLLTVRPGGIVRGKGQGGRPEPLYEAFDVQRGLAMLELMVGERESRTGITRLNQGLDADALNKTATGTALMQAQGQQMEEYIARNFAESMARLFMKKLRLMVAKGDPIAMKVEGNYKTVDPSEWSPDMDVSIRVGLGSGRKDQRLMYRGQLLAYQQQGIMAGLCTDKHIWNNMQGMIRDAAIGNPSDYWLDPDTEEAQKHGQEMAAKQAQQPDPKMVDAQTKMHATETNAQVQVAKMATDQQTTAATLAQKEQDSVRRADTENYRTEVEAMIALHNNVTKPHPGGSLSK